jgi:hypothetical protein
MSTEVKPMKTKPAVKREHLLTLNAYDAWTLCDWSAHPTASLGGSAFAADLGSHQEAPALEKSKPELPRARAW